MTLIDFVNKYDASSVDYDKKYGAQCVDLIRQYTQEVLHVPQIEGMEGAKDAYLKYNERPITEKYFERIPATKRDYKRGDLIIWDKSGNNPYGHIAIIVEATKDFVLVFEQDGYNQKRGAYIKLKEYSPKILGVLRCRK